MKLLHFVAFAFFTVTSVFAQHELLTSQKDSCVQFSVAPGTGCQWMHNYCTDQLNTDSYYFTDNLCIYDQNPISGKLYTCCVAGTHEDHKKITKIKVENNKNVVEKAKKDEQIEKVEKGEKKGEKVKKDTKKTKVEKIEKIEKRTNKRKDKI